MISINKEESISVIVPLFNSVKTIESTINSIISQQNVEIELIIVDDCSTDGSYKLVRKIATRNSRIKVYKTSSNSGGPAVPRNLGINNATKRWIAFCDADDIWLSNKLTEQVKLAKLTNARFVCTKVVNFVSDSSHNFINKFYLNHTKCISKYSIIYFNQMIFKNLIPTSSVLIARSLVDEIGEFNTSNELVEDYDFWLRALKAENYCVKLQRTFVLYRISKNSHSRDKIKMLKKVIAVLSLSAMRDGWKNLFLILIPVCILSHIIISSYLRLFRKSF
jgi:teichuronic acid biosynthesis glycosyltransferase TuaG